MHLQAWNSAWRNIDFDPATGSATLIRLPGPRPENATPHGFAHFERRVFGARRTFAVFKSGDDLFFSAGSTQWKLGDPDLSFKHSHPFPFTSRFWVLESGQVAYSILYSHFGRSLFAIMDPTYDQIDEDSDYFLAFMAENAQDPEWVKNIRARWLPG
jgi:hypothetical protein